MSRNNYVASNNGTSTLAGNLTAISTSFSIYTGQGSRFPSINDGGAANSEYTEITFQKADGTKEIVNVVRHDTGSDSFTIGVPGTSVGSVSGRGQGGTSATTWSIGDVVALRVTAAMLEASVNAATRTELDAVETNGLAATATAQATADAALPSDGSGTMTGDMVMGAGTKTVYEGTTEDAFELTVDPGDPTADRTQTHQDASGTLALIGVKEVIGCFPAAALKVATTSGAAPLAWDESATYKVMTGYLAFDASTQEYAQFSFRAPTALDESAGFTARFVWKEAGSATTHDCMWQIEMQAQGDADTVDSAWGTAVTVTDTGAADNRYISAETATITPGGTWAAGDEIIVRVSRNAADAADTLDVDAHLIEVVLFATYAASAEP